MAEIRLPTRGLADQTPLRQTPPTTAPLGGLQNMVALRPGTGREQLTKRPGLVKAFDTRLGDGPVQGLKAIARASAVTSFTIGESTPIDESNGRARRSIKVDANTWLMPVTGGLPRGLRDTLKVVNSAGTARVQTGGAQSTDFADITGVAGFATAGNPWAVAINPQGTLAASLINYTDGTPKTLITIFDPRTGLFIGCKILAGGTSAVGEAVTWTASALWIAKGAVLHYVPTPLGVLSDATTTVFAAAASAGSLVAADKITGLCNYTDADGATWLYACFEGNTAAGVTGNPAGVVTSGGYARHFRSGIYRLAEVTTGTGTMDFTIDQFGEPAQATDPYVELASAGSAPIEHKTVRFSQVLARRAIGGRGARPSAIACNALGFVAVAFCNQGWGPTTAFPPDGSSAYSTVAKFDAAGALRWEADTDSIITGEAGGKITGIATTYATDCPNEDGANIGTTSKNGPAIRAVAIDTFGDVYAAGRIANGPSTVFGIQSGSGNRKWQKSLADPAQAPGVAAYQTPSLGLAIGADGLIVAFTRSTLWPAFTSYADLWQLDFIDGAIDWSYSITQNAPAAPPDNDPTPTCIALSGSVLVWGSALFTD